MVANIQHRPDELEALQQRIASRFQRPEPHRRALGYLRGLLSTCERKNGC